MQPHHGAHFTSQIEVADFLKNTSTYSTFHRNLLLRKGLPLCGMIILQKGEFDSIVFLWVAEY